MKKIVFALLLFISISANAQRMLVLPDTPVFANQNRGVWVLRIADGLPYYSNGTRWVANTGGLGPQTISDSLTAYNSRVVTSFNGLRGPVKGVDSIWFTNSGGTMHWRWNNLIYSQNISAGVGSNAWGTITGSISSQTDLQAVLNLKMSLSDTSTMLAPYLRISDTTGKWITNIYRRADSVFKVIGGVELFAYKDSVGAGGGTVSSVFGRTGTVTAQEADYNAYYPLLSGTYNNPSWLNELAWTKITGKPSTFTPSSHNHPASDLTQSGATTGQVLKWNGTNWVPDTDNTGGGSANDSIFGTPYTKVGYVINDNFPGTTLSANWTDVTPSATVTVNNKVTMAGGSTNFADYLQNSTFNFFELNDWILDVQPTIKDATSYGSALGIEGVNSVTALNYRLYVSVDLTNTSTSGTIKLNSSSSTVMYTHPVKISFSQNDNLRITVKRRYTYFIVRVDNFTTAKYVEFTYRYPTTGWSYIIPPVSRMRIYNLGGTNNYTVASSYSHNRRGGVVWIGNSISTGYASTDFDTRASALTFLNDPSKYTVIAGPGAVSSDVAAYATQIASYGYSQAIVNIGVNDAGQFVSTSVYKSNVDSIRARLTRGGATVHLMNLVPGRTVDMTNYNTQLSDLATTYSLKLIDIFSKLKQAANTQPQNNYTYDGVHLTDSGYIIVKNELLTTVPEVQNELLADTISPAFIHSPAINDDEVIGVIVKDALGGVRTLYRKVAFKSETTPLKSGVSYSNGITIGAEYRSRNGFLSAYTSTGNGNYQVLKLDTATVSGSVRFQFRSYDNADPVTFNGGSGFDFFGQTHNFYAPLGSLYASFGSGGITTGGNYYFGGVLSGWNYMQNNGSNFVLSVNSAVGKHILQYSGGTIWGTQFDAWDIFLPKWNGSASFNVNGAVQYYDANHQFRAYRNSKALNWTLEGNATLTYSATTNIDMNVENHQTVNLTGDITFTTSNRIAGRDVIVRIVADGSTRNLTFPSWKWVGSAAPASIASGKTGLLILRSFGANDTDIVAQWVVEL